jgi:hypothetical protein
MKAVTKKVRHAECKSSLGEFLNIRWESKVMPVLYIRTTGSLLVCRLRS